MSDQERLAAIVKCANEGVAQMGRALLPVVRSCIEAFSRLGEEMREYSDDGEGCTHSRRQRTAPVWETSPGRFAVQRQTAIGGWIILAGKDSINRQDRAVRQAARLMRDRQYPTRVVDRVLREVVWPEEMKGERF